MGKMIRKSPIFAGSIYFYIVFQVVWGCSSQVAPLPLPTVYSYSGNYPGNFSFGGRPVATSFSMYLFLINYCNGSNILD